MYYIYILDISIIKRERVCVCVHICRVTYAEDAG